MTVIRGSCHINEASSFFQRHHQNNSNFSPLSQRNASRLTHFNKCPVDVRGNTPLQINPLQPRSGPYKTSYQSTKT
ncbi:hypothetical protein KP509_28G007000 [Ceratopteris richardii]|uniref:Uncharacterized protein n=1 Tax=Ceratopteris richardii TaxID=49495 RepID=A0A8T2RBU9_CERRI|nr:hypothetical protein KP509_28G007000 [Ceratopteris richardii]